MRALVLVVVAAILVVGCDELDDATPATPPPKPAPPTRVQAAAADKAMQACRDNCEQTNILAGGGDDALRGCRAGCDARFGVAATAHDVPSRISVAKPAHAPPAVRPIAP
ncbi:MAG TPA: hypothetical protein VGL86_29040 [Polyangia bacterium]